MESDSLIFLIFAVVMIVVLAKTMDAKPKETQFNEDTDEL